MLVSAAFALFPPADQSLYPYLSSGEIQAKDFARFVSSLEQQVQIA